MKIKKPILAFILGALFLISLVSSFSPFPFRFYSFLGCLILFFGLILEIIALRKANNPKQAKIFTIIAIVLGIFGTLSMLFPFLFMVLIISDAVINGNVIT